ncbi:undecaprenyl-diphosphate phosphatase [soil metagenome]
MNPLLAILYGIVEGVTEYLPVSSTGHLILLAALLHREAGSFEIVIQFGAILAVVVHYRALLLERLRGLVRGEKKARALLLALVVGFLPLAVLGFAVGKKVKNALFHPVPVAIALIVGGIVMIVVERVRKLDSGPATSIDDVTPRRALIVGIGQCFALFPGASRSMCTIVAGRLAGLSRKTAAEFSFLLGIPTLGAATAYSALKEHKELHDVGVLNVAIGMIVSFFVAWGVVAVFLRYLEKRGLEPFGAYRILLGIVVLLALR